MEHHQYSGEPHPAPSQPPDPASGSAAFDAANAPDAFRMAVDLVAVGISHMDLTGRLLYANPALCQLVGYSREELLGRTFQDIIRLDDASEPLASFRRLLAGETSACELEQQYTRRDGVVRCVCVTLTLCCAPADTPPFVIASVEDISEHKRMEEELRTTNLRLTEAVRESEQQAHDLEATFEAITDLVVVFDAAGQIRQVNQATENFMGRHRTLEAGRQRLALTDAQGRPFLPEEWVSHRVLQGETLTGAQSIDMLAAGAGAGQDVFFNVSGAPVRDPQGKASGGVLVMRDVTERRQLERRTQEALEALLRMAETLVAPVPESTTEAPPDVSGPHHAPALNPVAQRLAELASRVLGSRRVGIVALDTDPGATVMHPVALTGLTPEQAVTWRAGLEGRSMEEFIGSDSLRALRAGEVAQLDLNRQPMRSVARGGPVALAVPLRVGDQLVGALALGYEQEPHTYSRDELALAQAVGQLAALVIERERLLREREEARANALALREANRRMDEFLGIAAHELRTPLTSLLMNLELLERRFTDVSFADLTREDLADQLHRVDRVLGTMVRQGRLLNRLINDLIDASRIRTGKLEFRMRACDLAAIVHEAVEEQRQAQPQRTIDLELPGDAQVKVVADAERLGQAVTNYLTNALKYSRHERPVEARLRVDGNMARVSVRDYGPGLPPEEQPRVWELFHRAPGVKEQAGSGIGLGLGLHICKTIIESHGGRVGVDSAEGRGSTFWFTVPLASSQRHHSPSPRLPGG